MKPILKLLMLPLSCALLLGACETQPKQDPVYQRHSAPQQGVEMRIKLTDAPGVFAQAIGSAQYTVDNSAQCSRGSKIAGNVRNISTQENIPLQKISDSEYLGVFYNDLMVDEDYFGLGTCQWSLSHITVGLARSQDPQTTFFVLDVKPQHIQAQQMMRYFETKYYAQVGTSFTDNGKERLEEMPDQDPKSYFQATVEFTPHDPSH